MHPRWLRPVDQEPLQLKNTQSSPTGTIQAKGGRDDKGDDATRLRCGPSRFSISVSGGGICSDGPDGRSGDVDSSARLHRRRVDAGAAGQQRHRRLCCLDCLARDRSFGSCRGSNRGVLGRLHQQSTRACRSQCFCRLGRTRRAATSGRIQRCLVHRQVDLRYRLHKRPGVE